MNVWMNNFEINERRNEWKKKLMIKRIEKEWINTDMNVVWMNSKINKWWNGNINKLMM